MSSENNAAATIDPPAGDDTTGSPSRGRRGSGPAKTYEFKVYLDGDGVATVGGWEADHLPDSAVFCSDDEGAGVRIGRPVHVADLMWVATVEAVDRDAAVGALLVGENDLGERATVARAVHAAHVNLDFKALNTASGYMADVPAYWEIVATPKIGGR